MTPMQIIKHYGNGKVGAAAYALNLARQTIYDWRKRGRVPPLWQAWIEKDTAGVLKADGRERP